MGCLGTEKPGAKITMPRYKITIPNKEHVIMPMILKIIFFLLKKSNVLLSDI